MLNVRPVEDAWKQSIDVELASAVDILLIDQAGAKAILQDAYTSGYRSANTSTDVEQLKSRPADLLLEVQNACYERRQKDELGGKPWVIMKPLGKKRRHQKGPLGTTKSVLVLEPSGSMWLLPNPGGKDGGFVSTAGSKPATSGLRIYHGSHV